MWEMRCFSGLGTFSVFFFAAPFNKKIKKKRKRRKRKNTNVLMLSLCLTLCLAPFAPRSLLQLPSKQSTILCTEKRQLFMGHFGITTWWHKESNKCIPSFASFSKKQRLHSMGVREIEIETDRNREREKEKRFGFTSLCCQYFCYGTSIRYNIVWLHEQSTDLLVLCCMTNPKFILW